MRNGILNLMLEKNRMTIGPALILKFRQISVEIETVARAYQQKITHQTLLPSQVSMKRDCVSHLYSDVYADGISTHKFSSSGL